MKGLLSKTVFIIVAVLWGTASGFAPEVIRADRKRFSLHVGDTKEAPRHLSSLSTVRNISYGEKSRRYRRTIFDHNDWRKHRSPNRFLYQLRTIVASGIYKNIRSYVYASTAVSIFVCIFNALVGGFTDFHGVRHVLFSNTFLTTLGLPMLPFTLSSPSLGLLLVFRTNTGYQRWDEARKNWGLNINHTRDLVRMANAMYDKKGVTEERRQKDLSTLALCTWAFVRAMKRHLSPEDEDEEEFRKELYEKLPKKQADGIFNAGHRPNRALQDLSTAIENLNMHFLRKDKLHSSVTKFEDNLGSSERLLTSPVPLFYTRHTQRFLSAWLFSLPFALYDAFGQTWNHFMMIPASVAISTFLFGIEELSIQLEEPFTILPMQEFCNKIYTWCAEIASWKDTDSGIELYEPKPEHMTVGGIHGSPAM